MAIVKHTINEFPVPQTVRQENALLGALVCTPWEISTAEKDIDSRMFSDKANQSLWARLTEMNGRGEDITLTGVMSACETAHFQNDILPNCIERSPLEVEAMIKSLLDQSLKRRMYFQCVDSLTKIETEEDVAVAVEGLVEFSKKLQDVTCKEKAVHVDTVMNEVAENLEKRQADAKAGRPGRIPTSIPYLDFLTYDGFTNGDLVILAARPSVGKTGLALQMAMNCAARHIPVTFYSLEMLNTQLVQRMLFSTGDVKPIELARGDVDWTKLEEASGKICGVPMWLCDKIFQLEELVRDATAAVKKNHARMILVDYLGLISIKGERSTYENISKITKRLKRLALELEIPVIVLAQLNREMEKEKREPRLSDLRDSGSIEQDADIVLMLGTPVDGEGDDEVNLYVRKNRQGRRDIVIPLQMNESHTIFTQRR